MVQLFHRPRHVQDDPWSVPINLGINQFLTLGGQRVQIGGGLRYWAESSDDGPEGLGIRAIVTFLFPVELAPGKSGQ